jgi:hypothetical protein
MVQTKGHNASNSYLLGDYIKNKYGEQNMELNLLKYIYLYLMD